MGDNQVSTVEMMNNLINIFQMGWFNHQLETYFCVNILHQRDASNKNVKTRHRGGAMQGIAQNLAKQVVLHPFDTARYQAQRG